MCNLVYLVYFFKASNEPVKMIIHSTDKEIEADRAWGILAQVAQSGILAQVT